MDMGILGDLGKKVADTAKTAYTNVSNEYQRRQDIINKKNRILDRFEMKDLKKICKDYGIGEPSPYKTDPIDGKKYKVKIDRYSYISLVMKNLTLEQIKNYTDKNRIRINDILGQTVDSQISILQPGQPEKIETRASEDISDDSRRPDTFQILLSKIEKDFIPEPVRDEKELETQLVQFLRGNKIELQRQVQTPYGKVDVVIQNDFALELKVVDNKTKLRDLIGQLEDYKKQFKNLAAVLLDIGTVNQSDITEYCNSYAKRGIRSIVLRGSIRTKHGRGNVNIRIGR